MLTNMDSVISFQGREGAINIQLVEKKQKTDWLREQTTFHQNWVNEQSSGSSVWLPSTDGTVEKVVLFVDDKQSIGAFAQLAKSLPEGRYTLVDETMAVEQVFTETWARTLYCFSRYKESKGEFAVLQVLPELESLVRPRVAAEYWLYDLINTPSEDLTPDHMSQEVKAFAKTVGAKFTEYPEKKVKDQFPAIYAVGKAAASRPRLLEVTWGDKRHPKLTLVGKGVCYDTGGLSLKPTMGMLLMKKDMGGAAHVLALAHMITAYQLPVYLRVLIPAVENSVSQDAYRPGDVVHTRLGKTVEITNTDAEGRVILADALSYACEDEPDLLIDFATLTGAAQVALGSDIGSVFSNRDELASELTKLSNQCSDNLWHMPLHAGYRSLLDSTVADLVNSASSRFGGSITAALFLAEFVDKEVDWVHLDIRAWNSGERKHMPIGAKTQGLTGVFEYLMKRYTTTSS